MTVTAQRVQMTTRADEAQWRIHGEHAPTDDETEAVAGVGR